MAISFSLRKTVLFGRCAHIGEVGRRNVHHEARFTCLEKDW